MSNELSAEGVDAAIVGDAILAVEQQLAAAIKARDVATAGSLLADDFVLSSRGGMGDHVTRSDWLAMLDQIETRALSPEVLGTRVFGETAVARLVVHWDATLGERDLSGDYAITDVFRRDGGAWRLAWRISVRLADE